MRETFLQRLERERIEESVRVQHYQKVRLELHRAAYAAGRDPSPETLARLRAATDAWEKEALPNEEVKP